MLHDRSIVLLLRLRRFSEDYLVKFALIPGHECTRLVCYTVILIFFIFSDIVWTISAERNFSRLLGKVAWAMDNHAYKLFQWLIDLILDKEQSNSRRSKHLALNVQDVCLMVKIISL